MTPCTNDERIVSKYRENATRRDDSQKIQSQSNFYDSIDVGDYYVCITFMPVICQSYS